MSNEFDNLENKDTNGSDIHSEEGVNKEGICNNRSKDENTVEYNFWAEQTENNAPEGEDKQTKDLRDTDKVVSNNELEYEVEERVQEEVVESSITDIDTSDVKENENQSMENTDIDEVDSDNDTTEQQVNFIMSDIPSNLNEHTDLDGMNQENDSDTTSYGAETTHESVNYQINQSEAPAENTSYRLRREDLLIDESASKEDNFEDIFSDDRIEPSESKDKKVKKSGKALKVVKFIGLAAAFGVIAGASFFGINYAGNKLQSKDTTETIGNSNGSLSTNNESKKEISTTTVSNNVTNETNDVSDLVEQTMPSIVSIKSSISQTVTDFFGRTYDEEGEGSGSGIIVGKNDTELLIVTNNHVVEDAKTIKVTFIDNEEVTAEVKGKDSTSDLAVLAIKLSDIDKETSDQIKIAVLGDSDKVKVGQMAVAIGNALGYGQSVTVGYISAKDRSVQVSDTQTMVLLQTDAAINPGNSGGALLNINGEVIGINSAKTAANEVEGMGYAIPISQATPIINELMNREVLSEDEQGYLGITGEDVTDTEVSKFNMPLGISITSVIEDGPADKAGLKHGDIITKVNGTEVTNFDQMKEKINSYRVGTEITITYMRSDNGEHKENTVTVKLGEKPEVTESTDNNLNQVPNENGNDSQDDSESIEDFFNFGN